MNIKIKKFLKSNDIKHIQKIQLDIRKISRTLQKCLLKKREIKKHNIQSSVMIFVIISIITLLFIIKKNSFARIYQREFDIY
jgi:hypothetical protein